MLFFVVVVPGNVAKHISEILYLYQIFNANPQPFNPFIDWILTILNYASKSEKPFPVNWKL